MTDRDDRPSAAGSKADGAGNTRSRGAVAPTAGGDPAQDQNGARAPKPRSVSRYARPGRDAITTRAERPGAPARAHEAVLGLIGLLGKRAAPQCRFYVLTRLAVPFINHTSAPVNKSGANPDQGKWNHHTMDDQKSSARHFMDGFSRRQKFTR